MRTEIVGSLVEKYNLFYLNDLYSLYCKDGLYYLLFEFHYDSVSIVHLTPHNWLNELNSKNSNYCYFINSKYHINILREFIVRLGLPRDFENHNFDSTIFSYLNRLPWTNVEFEDPDFLNAIDDLVCRVDKL